MPISYPRKGNLEPPKRPPSGESPPRQAETERAKHAPFHPGGDRLIASGSTGLLWTIPRERRRPSERRCSLFPSRTIPRKRVYPLHSAAATGKHPSAAGSMRLPSHPLRPHAVCGGRHSCLAHVMGCIKRPGKQLPPRPFSFSILFLGNMPGVCPLWHPPAAASQQPPCIL